MSADRGGLDYRDAGVNLAAADAAKRRMRRLVESTYTSGVRGGFGGFGGLFRVPEPPAGSASEGRGGQLLVASADGVGTKLKIAIDANRHDTVGHDLVNHCVNDVLVQGATPLFFLDYIAFSVLDPAVAEAIVAGIAAGCRENECALIGGETAELPGLYTAPDYDLAGFLVGTVSESDVLGAHRVREGDAVLGLASNGLHTNGYSLARRIVTERLGLRAGDRFPGTDATVADVLLKVHRSYLRALRGVLPDVHALAHITGGGLPGNVSRVLPHSLDAEIDGATWEIPHEFAVLAEEGGVARAEMFRAFNMGVGMVVIAPPERLDDVVAATNASGVPAWRLGQIVRGSGQVIIH
jgi:phosphoribosylformylglycinamidine cyclo-ligase